MCQVMVVSPSRNPIILLQPVSLWFPNQDTATQLFKCIMYLTLMKQPQGSAFIYCNEEADGIHRPAPPSREDASSSSLAVLCGITTLCRPSLSSEDTSSLRADVSSTNTHSIHSTTAGCQGTRAKPHLNGSIHSVCFFTSSCGTPLSNVNPVSFNQKYNRSQQPQRYEWSNSRKRRHFRSLCCNHSCLFFFVKTVIGLEHGLWALCPDWQMFEPQSLSRYPTLGPTLALSLVIFPSIWLFYDGAVSHLSFRQTAVLFQEDNIKLQSAVITTARLHTSPGASLWSRTVCCPEMKRFGQVPKSYLKWLQKLQIITWMWLAIFERMWYWAKELLVDFSRTRHTSPSPRNIQGRTLRWWALLSTWEFTWAINWTVNTSALYQKGQGRLHLLREVRSFGGQGPFSGPCMTPWWHQPSWREWSAGAAAAPRLQTGRD